MARVHEVYANHNNNVPVFQDIYPMLAASDVKISSKYETAVPSTVFMNGLHFSNSHWQLFHVSLQMIECHTNFLTLELTDTIDVSVGNSSLGSWSFKHVQQFIISNSTAKGMLNFYNSSGSMENIITTDTAGFIIQSYSYVEITKSQFVNSVVQTRLIKVLESSTIVMSDSTIENNQIGAIISALEYCSISIYRSTFRANNGGVFSLFNSCSLLLAGSSFFNNSTSLKGGLIYSYNSTLNLSDSDFDHNKGGVFLLMLSAATVNNCTFFNNSNTAVVVFHNTTISMTNSTFESNSSPDVGGAVLVEKHSKVQVSNTTFLRNSAQAGGSFFVRGHSLLDISYTSFSENSAMKTMYGLNPIYKDVSFEGGAIRIGRSELNIFQSQFYNNSAYDSGGSVFSTESSLCITSTLFESNFAGSLSGGAIASFNHSSLVIETSQFVDNTVQDKAVGNGGGLSLNMNSTAMISSVDFIDNKAEKGGALYASVLCELTVHNNTMEFNAGSAIFIKKNVYLHILNSRFFNNSMTHNGGAIHSGFGNVLNVTYTIFSGNKAISSGGSFFGCAKTNASFFHCSFTDNSAFKGGAVTAINVQFVTCNFTWK